MKKITCLLFCLIAGVGLVTAQTRPITGTVISADDGEPIIGASIIVKGTTTGTVTNIDGVFELNVPSSATTLVISYVGMTPLEVAITDQPVMARMTSSLELEEVVVTAMGISREKKALGYAVQDLKADELTQAASTSLSDALQGKVSGMEIATSSGMPGASAKITIRGSRSFTGDNTPLYVVDGMPIASTSDEDTYDSVTGSDYANRSIDIDPNDIESINILKGQAASALYGMRASNGVIVITTRSGKNARKGKPEITFRSNLAVETLSVKPNMQTEYAQGSGGGYNPTASMSWGPLISELANDPTYGGNVNNAYTQADGLHQGQYYVLQRARAGLDPWATPQVYHNIDEFFRTGTTWSNNVNVAQSMDKGHYAFSLGNTSSKGIMPTTGLERYNAKLSAETRLHEQWTMGFNGNFSTSILTKQTGANDGLVATIYAAPPSYDFAGIPPHLDGDPYSQNTYRGTGGFDGAYWAIENNSFTERSHRFFGNAYTHFTTRMGTDNQRLDVKYQLGNDAYTTHYSDVWGYGHSNQRGQIEEFGYTINELNSLLTFNYDWNVSPDLNLNVLAGNEFIHRTRKYDYAYGKDFNFSGWNHMNNVSIYTAEESYRAKRSAGLFANVSLAYKNRLYLNATGRNDRVSNMPRGSRTFFYPSISAGFIFTELEAVKNDVLTFGKLRASYAEVGQAADEYYNSYYSTPVYGGGFSSGTPIIYPIGSIVAYTPYSRVYDPNLKPQNTKSFELGTDLTFMNGLVSLNYTFSRQNINDQIFDVPLAGSTGYENLVTNGGSMHTNAHEITLSVAPVRNKNIRWDFAFNFSKIDNYVDELAEGVESIFMGGFLEPQVRAGIGYKYPVIYGVGFLRNEEGKIVVDDDGLPQPGAEKVIGTVSPDFRLGFNTSLEVCKFRLAAVLEWKQGGEIYSATPGLLHFYGVTQKSADFRKKEFIFEQDAVKVTGTDAQGNPVYAKNDIVINGENSTATAQDYFSVMTDISEGLIAENSFVKLREISLSYPVWEKPSLQVAVNAFARNLLLWSTIKEVEPESTQGNNNMSGAFERFSLPGTSSYGLGITVKF
jgi:TonB-linked SusC/RagA family outer membrane protein